MRLASAIDRTLDLTIAPGYGRPGLAIRGRLRDWPADPPRMDGKTVLVTGAVSGIGLASCQGFARLGARVLAVGRDQRRGQDARAEILKAVPGAEVIGIGGDVSSLKAVRELAARVNAEQPALHALVHNAGVMPAQRRRSAEEHELMFATHVLGPCALTALLAGLLARSAPARVITVSSGGMYGQPLRSDDPESERDRYRPALIYARTKRQQVAITEAWAQRLQGSGAVAHSMHPGVRRSRTCSRRKASIARLCTALSTHERTLPRARP